MVFVKAQSSTEYLLLVSGVIVVSAMAFYLWFGLSDTATGQGDYSTAAVLCNNRAVFAPGKLCTGTVEVSGSDYECSGKYPNCGVALQAKIITISLSISPQSLPQTNPQNTFTSPAANQARITLTATVKDPKGTLNFVEFYNGTAKLARDATAPYSYAWRPPLGTHTITAKAIDASNAATTSAPITITVSAPAGEDIVPPSTPTNLSAELDSTYPSTRIKLTWIPSTDPSPPSLPVRYNIYRNGAFVQYTQATSFTDGVATPLQPGTAYTYTVSAFDSAPRRNTSGTSNAVTATTQALLPPAFFDGARVKTIVSADVYESADRAVIAAEIPQGATGTISGDLFQEDEIRMWYVEFDNGANGWAFEQDIAPAS